MEKSEFRRYAQEAFRQMDEHPANASDEQIGEFVRGEAPAGFERHLAACDLCRQRVADFEQFLAASQHPAVEDLTQEWRELRRRIWWRKAQAALPRWGSLAAAIL